MNKKKQMILCMASLFYFNSIFAEPIKTYSLNEVIQLALEKDYWLKSSYFNQKSMEEKSISDGTLPDPKFYFDFQNIPTDNFDLNKESMTQFKIGFSQKIPRGETLKLKSKKTKLMSEIQPFEREDRKRKIQVKVSNLYLNIYNINKKIEINNNAKLLLKELLTTIESKYLNITKNVGQEDYIRVNLEISKIEDQLIYLMDEKEKNINELNSYIDNNFISYETSADYNSDYKVSNEFPNINVKRLILDNFTLTQYDEILKEHPQIKIFNKKIRYNEVGIDIEKQKYKPEWNIRANYGYRMDNSYKEERSDLFSIGFSFDVPIYTNNKQDKYVSSAINKTESIKTDKILLLRKFTGEIKKYKDKINKLNNREALYFSRLLPEMEEQIEAYKTSYESTNGDFSDVILSQISLLEMQLTYLDIKIEKQKNIVKLNYFL